MDGDFFAAVFLFAVAASATPGPNNIIAAASGLNFGYRRTLPFILGVACGFPLMIAAIGAGLGGVFAAFPIVHTVLRYCGAAFLCFLAWKIAFAPAVAPAAAESAKGAPLSFFQSAAFQWVNPKAWVMGSGAISAYTSGGDIFLQVAAIALIFAPTAFCSVSLWSLSGAAIRRRLAAGGRWPRIFNAAMGLLLAASVAPILLS